VGSFCSGFSMRTRSGAKVRAIRQVFLAHNPRNLAKRYPAAATLGGGGARPLGGRSRHLAGGRREALAHDEMAQGRRDVQNVEADASGGLKRKDPGQKTAVEEIGGG